MCKVFMGKWMILFIKWIEAENIRKIKKMNRAKSIRKNLTIESVHKKCTIKSVPN